MTPIIIKFLLNELQAVKTRKLFVKRRGQIHWDFHRPDTGLGLVQAVGPAPPGPDRRGLGSPRMCGHKSALQITALLLNSAVATSAAAALDR